MGTKNSIKAKEYQKRWYQANREKRLAEEKLYREENRELINSRRRDHYAANKKLMRDKKYQWNLKRAYGLSQDAYDKLVKDSQNKCYICHRDFCDELRSYIDHCHKTGIVRGLLCNSCNTKLGWLERYEERIKNYLVR